MEDSPFDEDDDEYYYVELRGEWFIERPEIVMDSFIYNAF